MLGNMFSKANESVFSTSVDCDLLHAGLRAGLKIDDFAPRLSFFWGIGMNFYMASVCSSQWTLLLLRVF